MRRVGQDGRQVGSACGHTEPRTWESSAPCQRRFAHKAGSLTRQPRWGAGVGPQRQCKKDGQVRRVGKITRVLLAAAMALIAVNSQAVTLAAIHAYQHTLSPLATRAGIRCRFTPTCSRYAELVIRRDGVLRGGWKTVKRVGRCNPLTPIGTRDEP